MFNLPSALHTQEGCLWAMAQVAHRQCERQYHLLQESAWQVAEKVSSGGELAPAEQVYAATLFANPWWGGEAFGFNESRHWLPPVGNKSTGVAPFAQVQEKNIADLHQLEQLRYVKHYLDGGGELLAANLNCYQHCVIVKDVTAALKIFIKNKINQRAPATLLSTTHKEFLLSDAAQQVERKRAHSEDSGYLFNDGTMVLELKNKGLTNFLNRFSITAMTTQMAGGLHTRWRVDGLFSIPDFNDNFADFELPLTGSINLKIRAGLGRELQNFTDAKPFRYFAAWAEMHR